MKTSEMTLPALTSGIRRLENRIADLEQLDTKSLGQARSPHALEILNVLERSIADTLDGIFGLNAPERARYARASILDPGPAGYFQPEVTRAKDRVLVHLRRAVAELKEELADRDQSHQVISTAKPELSQARPITPSNKIFIVHGHSGEPREAVARFIERIGFEPIILQEQANQSRTIVEKFEDHADVGFAIILLTPDDVGRAKDAPELQPRARQNVVLELGYFIGRLGRAQVCAIKMGELEFPSDILGVAWTPFDSGGAWRQSLAKELDAAGYTVDWNKVMRS